MQFEDVRWQHVRTQMHGDEQKSVWEKWFTIGRDPQFLSMYARWDPGMVVHRHGHNSEQIVFVIAGELTVDGRLCTPGTFMVLEQGASMGPMIAGPNGVTLFESYSGDPRSWPADPEEYERILAERGLKKLPNPVIQMIEQFPDTRSE